MVLVKRTWQDTRLGNVRASEGALGAGMASVRRPGSRAVDVWQVELAAEPPPIEWLDAYETARLQALATAALRARFLTAHAATRAILGAYVGCRPFEVDIGRARCSNCGCEHAKPFVRNDTLNLEYSLSHSRDLALLAVAERPVGIDVEWRGAAFDVKEVAAYVLSDDELAQWNAPEHADPQRRFFDCWTRKEAALKMTGIGLERPMHDVRIAPDQQSAAVPNLRGETKRVELLDLAGPDDHYSATLAIAAPRPMVRLRRWKLELVRAGA